MAWLRSGIKPLRAEKDTRSDISRDEYLVGLGKAAQKAELKGDRLVAELVHEEINREL
jgi:hypothetical protein